MGKNSEEFLKKVEALKKQKADFQKLPIEEQERLRKQNEEMLKKMASSPATFNN